MASYFILCVICVFKLAAADGKVNTAFEKNVPEMSDREMMEFMMTRISRLETDKNRQEKRIEILENTVLRQNEVIVSLEKDLDGKGLADDIKAEPDNTSNSEHVSSDDKTIKRKMNQNNFPINTYRTLGMGRTRRQVSATPVAFSSLLTNKLIHLGAHQDITFDKTYVNTNNVYNPNHGVFTAPVSGVYVITATILSDNNREVWADITVNGNVKATVYARGTDNRHDQGTQTILLHLKTGDGVSVQNEAVDDAIFGALYTTFSGFLLYEEEPTNAIVG